MEKSLGRAKWVRKAPRVNSGEKKEAYRKTLLIGKRKKSFERETSTKSTSASSQGADARARP